MCCRPMVVMVVVVAWEGWQSSSLTSGWLVRRVCLATSQPWLSNNNSSITFHSSNTTSHNYQIPGLMPAPSAVGGSNVRTTGGSMKGFTLERNLMFALCVVPSLPSRVVCITTRLMPAEVFRQQLPLITSSARPASSVSNLKSILIIPRYPFAPHHRT